jgi:hypothetical protein
MMPAYYEIPLTGTPQKFAVTLAGVEYNLTLTFHAADADLPNAPTGVDRSNNLIDLNDIGGWILDIFDNNNNPMACGLPLIVGIDLLYQFRYLGIGGALVVSVDGDPDGTPTFDGLGTTSHLYFVTFP